MEETQSASPQETPEAPGPMSFGSRMMNVIVSPGELFESLKTAPRSALNWVVPLLLLMIVAIASMLIMFTQPNMQQQFRDQNSRRIDKMVAQGKITSQQAEAQRQYSEPGSMMVTIFGSIGIIVTLAIVTFLFALVAWLVGRYALKGAVSYGLALEIVGLASVISILGSIITTLIMVAMDSMYATPSLAIFIGDYNTENTVHKLMTQANVFTIWYAAIIGLGLAKVSNAPTAKGMAWAFGIFIVIVAIAVFVF